jgi:trans-aconitate 2-methyltransferase
MTQEKWNAALYENKHAFVWNHGSDLIDILAPQLNEKILDLGCGTGQLTSLIASFGSKVTGIDYSSSMIHQAIKNYPKLEFHVADGANFFFENPFDAIFSNAALHWIKDQKSAIRCIRRALKPGGRFVAEFGADGNVHQIITAIEAVLSEEDYTVQSELNPWFFSNISKYATLLEQQGLDVTYAVIFDRPIRLEGGEEGMDNWIKMFGNSWLSIVPDEKQIECLQKIKSKLRFKLYQDKSWFVDYKRLRIVAKLRH